jgi:hypothetical protein
MKNVLSLPMLFLVISASKCSTPAHRPPKAELCITGDNYELACADQRLPEGERSYLRSYTVNYICTNSNDYEAQYNYCSNLREKLIRCESGRKR